MPGDGVNIDKLTELMARVLEQEGLLSSDVLGGLHMVIDELAIEAIEEGLVDPDDIDPPMSDLYDAYEVYKLRPTEEKLRIFEEALLNVGQSIGPMPFKWTAEALSKSLHTADQWIIDHPRYAEGIYAAVTFIAQEGGFNDDIVKSAKSLMLDVEELEEGKVSEDKLLQHSRSLAESLLAA